MNAQRFLGIRVMMDAGSWSEVDGVGQLPF